MIEGIIYRYRCGIAWRDLPAEFGPWKTVWKRHRWWAADGISPVSRRQCKAVPVSSGDLVRSCENTAVGPDCLSELDESMLRMPRLSQSTGRLSPGSPVHFQISQHLRLSAEGLDTEKMASND